MSFQYPYALLVLIAIPVLILIYILRNRYKEATAPSTYLWELSQKFLKKRNPFHSRENLIALFVQMFAIAFRAITLAHPVLSIKGQAEKRVFVLDGSASRNRKREGEGYDGKKTKFEAAKEDILQKVEAAKKGSTFSLIVSDKEPRTICQELTDAGQFKRYLDTLSCSYTASGLQDSISLAQKWVSAGNGTNVYLATDKKVNVNDNVSVRSYYNDKQCNYAILNVAYQATTPTDTQNYNTLVTPSYICYDHDGARFRLHFLINDKDYGYSTVVCEVKGTEYKMSFGFNIEEPVAKVEVKVDELIDEKNKGYKDCLDLDNSYVFYNEASQMQAKVLLVSNTPRYLTAALKAWGITPTVVSPSGYSAISGYDIYIFDSTLPDKYKLPTDGAVWFFGIGNERDDVGFNYEGSYSDTTDGFTCSFAQNSDSVLYEQLTDKRAKKDVLVSNYYRYTLTEDFTTILSYNNLPMIFAGKNGFNQREVVFSFPLSASSLPLSYDFVLLVRNLVRYSNPSLLNTFAYNVGTSATINVSDSVTARERTRPDGTTLPIVIGNDQYVTYDLDEIGSYTLKTTTNNNTDREIHLFVNYLKEEGSPIAEDDNAYEIVINSETQTAYGIFDSILPVAIAAAVFFGADWILYAREQY